MKEIEVNNGCKIVLENKSQGIEVIHCDSKGGIEYSYNIPDGDLVMLMNYYRNCKSGREKSDYISEGKIRNTNTDIVEYIQSKEIVIYSERQGNIMAKMRVMVVKYGYAVIEAETENEAIEKAENMSDGEFDWSDPDDTQVVDDDVDFE